MSSRYSQENTQHQLIIMPFTPPMLSLSEEHTSPSPIARDVIPSPPVPPLGAPHCSLPPGKTLAWCCFNGRSSLHRRNHQAAIKQSAPLLQAPVLTDGAKHAAWCPLGALRAFRRASGADQVMRYVYCRPLPTTAPQPAAH